MKIQVNINSTKRPARSYEVESLNTIYAKIDKWKAFAAIEDGTKAFLIEDSNSKEKAKKEIEKKLIKTLTKGIDTNFTIQIDISKNEDEYSVEYWHIDLKI